MKKKGTKETVPNTVVENVEEIKNTTSKQYDLERHKRVWESLFYSHQRMDTLIVTICGGGIYVTLEALKYFNTKGVEISYLLKISAIGFTLAIILNFIAQKISSKIHSLDYQKSTIEIDNDDSSLSKEKKEENKIVIDKLESQILKKDNLNSKLNWISIASMSTSLAVLVYFFLTTF